MYIIYIMFYGYDDDDDGTTIYDAHHVLRCRVLLTEQSRTDTVCQVPRVL